MFHENYSKVVLLSNEVLYENGNFGTTFLKSFGGLFVTEIYVNSLDKMITVKNYNTWCWTTREQSLYVLEALNVTVNNCDMC